MDEVEVSFSWNQVVTIIQAKLGDSFQSVIDKFIQKTMISPNSTVYLADGKQIEPQNTVESYMSGPNKQDKKIPIMAVTVEDDEEQEKTPVIVQSKDIICPECKELCLFTIENCHIKLFNCINNHTTRGIKFTDFSKSQEIDISKIVCDICKKKNKGHTTNHEFHFCFTCKQNICVLCNDAHDKKHKKDDYDMINYICQKHYEKFIKFCKNCYSNICYSCRPEHAQHETIDLINVDFEETKKKLQKIKAEIEKVTNNINEIINKFNAFIKVINMYYEINKNILDYYGSDKEKRNYQALRNINDININNEMYAKLKSINENNDILGKIKGIIDLDNEMNKNIKSVTKEKYYINNEEEKYDSSSKIKEENLNQMTMIYDTKKNKKIRILGENFVKNNKNNYYLRINGEKKELREYLEIKSNNKDTIEIKLLETKSITDMSYFFYECDSLKSLKVKPNWNIEGVTNICGMFSKCTSLISIEGIANWNTNNITDMSYLFSSCLSLKKLPDISGWNVQNVTDMNYMFNDCKSLESLPELSKWKINKSLDKEGMFDGVDKKIIPKKFKGCLIF